MTTSRRWPLALESESGTVHCEAITMMNPKNTVGIPILRTVSLLRNSNIQNPSGTSASGNQNQSRASICCSSTSAMPVGMVSS